MKAYGKAILRSATRSKARFLAIFAIVALGAGFAAGVFSAAPQMRDTVDAYLDSENTMDLELISTLGFSENDASAVSAADGVEAVMPSWYEDAMSRIGSENVALRIHALPEKGAQDTSADSMNLPVLVSGRWPQSADECVLGEKKIVPQKMLAIGDTVTVEEQDGEGSLKNKTFTIVGFVRSTLYLSYTLGSTDIGNGQLTHFLYVLPEAFGDSDYNCMFVRVKNAAALNSFTQSYKDLVQSAEDAVQAVGEQRAGARRTEVTASAQETVDENRADYESQKASAEAALAEARQKLDDAAAGIAENRQKLADSETELASGESELADARASFASEQERAAEELAAAEQKLEAARKELAAAEQELTENTDELAAAKQQLSASEKEYAEKQSSLQAAQAELKEKQQQQSAAETQAAQSRAALDAAAADIENAKAALAALQQAGLGGSEQAAALQQQIGAYEAKLTAQSEAEAELSANRTALGTAEQQLSGQAAALEQAGKELEKKSAELAASEQKLSAAAEELAAKKQALSKGETQMETQKSGAQQSLAAAQAELKQKEADLAEAERQIAEGKNTLAEAENTLAQNEADYAKSEADTAESLAEAEQKLNDAQAKIDAVALPVWYVLNRDQNVGIKGFSGDADRMQAIARLFPVFFFLVAALVVLTTMTRMVEEERSEIGAYKALGFPKALIAKKYVLYSVIVSLSGGVFGVTVGCLTLPSACWNAYRILYNAPAISPRMDWLYAALGCLLAAAVAVASTLCACGAELREKPAALLQPKAPKPGKRILLEHIGPLWKRMNFSAKVTARNLFRYKKRLCMTVAGIAGCTALMLTGFGLRDSVQHIVSYQFEELDRYNVQITLRESGLSQGAQAILNDTSRVTRWMACSERSADYSAGGTALTAYIVVPEKAEELSDFIVLRGRVSHSAVEFGKNSVVVTEKLASALGIGPGSTISVPDGAGVSHDFTVTGVTENYIYHFIYIDPELYQNVTGRTETPNEVLAQNAGTDASAQTSLGSGLLAQDGVATVAFLDDITSTFDNVIRALDVIVLIFIFCAGMLSFVVLYNLTNINITERTREMATLRVLGFTVRECEKYIYRETSLLTVIGCAAGLVLGIFMHAAVVTTVEVDLCMFPRDIAPLSYLWSMILTFGFTAGVDFIMQPKFRKINMAESLKSVD